MRHCCICGKHHVFTTYLVGQADLAILDRCGYTQHPPRSGAQHLACSVCQRMGVGVASRLRRYALMVATGLFVIISRTCPGLDELQGPALRAVRTHAQLASFRDARHGCADFRLDRCSLYITGPLNAMYGAIVIIFRCGRRLRRRGCWGKCRTTGAA